MQIFSFYAPPRPKFTFDDILTQLARPHMLDEFDTGEDPNKQRYQHRPQLENLPPSPQLYLGGNGLVLIDGGWESTRLRVLFEQHLLFVPPLHQPGVKVVQGVQGDLGHSEPSPVHVDGGLRVAFKVRGPEGEDVLAVLTFSVVLEWGFNTGKENFHAREANGGLGEEDEGGKSNLRNAVIG